VLDHRRRVLWLLAWSRKSQAEHDKRNLNFHLFDLRPNEIRPKYSARL